MASTTGTKPPKTGKRKSTSAGRRRTATPPKAVAGSAETPEAQTLSQTSDAVAPKRAPAKPVLTRPHEETSQPVQETSMTETMPRSTAADVGAAPGPDAISGSASSAGQSAADDRLRRPDLIEAVAARVSLKRSEAKMVFDVVLDEIGKALDASDEVVVPPLGKFMVKKRDIKRGGPMLTLKLKRAEAAPAAGDVSPLADPDADS